MRLHGRIAQMNLLTHDSIQSYVLEIICRTKVIKRQCEGLLSKDFISDAPIKLANTLINISDYIETITKSIFKLIDFENEEKSKDYINLLKITDFVVKELGQHVRYIDSPQTHKLPWSLINPMKGLVKQFLPNIEILLQPQWEYNYSIDTASLYQYYYSVLSAYENMFPETKVAEVLSKLDEFFYVVSFPSIERNNVLLHSLLGHEIGHLFAKEYLNKEREKEFLKSVGGKVTKIVSERVKSDYENKLPLLVPDLTQKMIQQEIERTTLIWQRGVEELLSDIIGAFLFGPAILFSQFEFSLSDLTGLDCLPNEGNNYYPPWRMRLRYILETVKELGFFPIAKGKFNDETGAFAKASERIEVIQKISADISDRKKIESIDILKIAYEEIEKDVNNAKQFYAGKLGELIISVKEYYKRLPHLVERLSYKIPPNALEKSVDDREPATIVEIINAAWFHKLSWATSIFDKDNNFNEEVIDQRDRMNRLTLKALEYSFTEKEFEGRTD